MGFFEYWINRWAAMSVGMLGDRKQTRRGWMRAGSRRPHRKKRCWAEENGRYVALNSPGRLPRWVGTRGRDPRRGYAPKAWLSPPTLYELFYALGAKSPMAADKAHDIERRIKLYFGVINILSVR